MKLDAFKLGLAAAIIVAIVWTICALFVVLLPETMMAMSGHMLHADFHEYRWTMHFQGFVVGLVMWTLLAGLLVWATALIYNKLSALPPK